MILWDFIPMFSSFSTHSAWGNITADLFSCLGLFSSCALNFHAPKHFWEMCAYTVNYTGEILITNALNPEPNVWIQCKMILRPSLLTRSNRMMYADRNPPLPSKEERKKLTLRDLKDLLKSVHSESPPTWFHRSSPIELHDPRYSATVEHRWEGEELKPLTKRHSFASWAVISIWIPTRTELTVKSHRDKKISQQLKRI